MYIDPPFAQRHVIAVFFEKERAGSGADVHDVAFAREPAWIGG